MGYETSYNLEICKLVDNKLMSITSLPSTTESESFDYIMFKLFKFSESAKCALDEDGESTGTWKWYNSETEVESFSKGFPDLVFVLTGEGEESGDLWKCYFKNGVRQMCKAQITYESFNPTLFENR